MKHWVLAGVVLFVVGGYFSGIVSDVFGDPKPIPRKRTVAASWYGEPFHGRLTASGITFDMYKVSAAHKTLPFGTRIRLTNPANGRQITAQVWDRGPYVSGRELDLSYEAARRLGFVKRGVAYLRLEVLQ